MAEAFKHQINPESVRTLALAVNAVDPAFDGSRFCTLAEAPLAGLELKARVAHVADTLLAGLAHQSGIEAILDVLVAAASGHPESLADWAWWPAVTLVERHALEVPEAGLDALHRLTTVHSAEFAIRPFLQAHPVLCRGRLERWSTDPSPLVRRLVSEGTRPRLPWGIRLRHDPSAFADLLIQLSADPADTVQLSVSNHVNDISKDHPDTALALARQLRCETRRVRHALRTLIKSGHAGALAAVGVHPPRLDGWILELDRSAVEMGQGIGLSATLLSNADQAIELDFVIHHRKKSGRLTPKVFKWARFNMSKGERRTLTRVHRFLPISTRTYHPGEHAVSIQVNGVEGPRQTFTLDVV